MVCFFKRLSLLTFLMVCANGNVFAQSIDVSLRTEKPPVLSELQNIKKENTLVDSQSALPMDIREDAVKEAALSYGARGGLAWRTYEIRLELENRARYLDKIFDFRQLLIPAPSGLLIEPPIISEAQDAMLIQSSGLDAAVAEKVLNINRNARIVSTARTWRSYLEREWDEVTPPPDILRPENAREREIWKELSEKGWYKGIEQAEDIFNDDLNQLVSHYQGMVRYRVMLAQGMISPPYAVQVDRGVTGGGNSMRIGDRSVKITDLPEFQTGYKQWQPANR
ncbi:MAG: type IV secretion system DotC family protein [Alphaproteobacteria bacterium]|nr:type IV secretion system DotC family protein [Alphaproteobacteria bacterium]